MSPPLGAFSLVGRAPAGVAPPEGYDPAEHAWSVLLVPSAYDGTTWAGTASTGASGTAAFGPGESPAAAGAPGGADFDGVDDFLEGPTLEDIIGAGATAWTIIKVVAPDAPPADPGPGARYLTANMVGDASAYYVEALTDSGVSLEMADGVNVSNLTVACPAGGLKLVASQYDGADYRLRVIGAADSGWAEQTLGPIAGTGAAVRLAVNYSLAAFYGGGMRAVFAAPRVVDDAELADVQAWIVANIGALS